MSEEKRKKAEQLLNAQVEYLMAQLEGEAFSELLRREVDIVLEEAEKLRLNEVVSVDQIHETARKYAVEMEIPAAVPELIGEIAERIYNHPGHDNNRFGDLVEDHEIEEVVQVLVEMKDLRERVIHEVAESPLILNLISDMLYRGIRGFVTEGTNMASSIPGASSMMKLGKSMMDRTAPGLEKTAEKNIKKYISTNTRPIIRYTEKRLNENIDNGELEKAVMEFWEELRERKIGEFRNYISRSELEDAMVTGLEVWKKVRRTRYLDSLIRAGVEFFFEKYGETTLAELVQEMGVTAEMIVEDGERFAPPIIAVLKEKGILQDALRRRLEGFFFDEKTLELL